MTARARVARVILDLLRGRRVVARLVSERYGCSERSAYRDLAAIVSVGMARYDQPRRTYRLARRMRGEIWIGDQDRRGICRYCKRRQVHRVIREHGGGLTTPARS